jgi:hypothetical protein
MRGHGPANGERFVRGARVEMWPLRAVPQHACDQLLLDRAVAPVRQQVDERSVIAQ